MTKHSSTALQQNNKIASYHKNQNISYEKEILPLTRTFYNVRKTIVLALNNIVQTKTGTKIAIT